jgi:hypothetical protein
MVVRQLKRRQPRFPAFMPGQGARGDCWGGCRDVAVRNRRESAVPTGDGAATACPLPLEGEGQGEGAGFGNTRSVVKSSIFRRVDYIHLAIADSHEQPVRVRELRSLNTAGDYRP